MKIVLMFVVASVLKMFRDIFVVIDTTIFQANDKKNSFVASKTNILHKFDYTPFLTLSFSPVAIL